MKQSKELTLIILLNITLKVMLIQEEKELFLLYNRMCLHLLDK
jgi:hypothetical protein